MDDAVGVPAGLDECRRLSEVGAIDGDVRSLGDVGERFFTVDEKLKLVRFLAAAIGRDQMAGEVRA
ncbi:MAG: hypothetical protein ACYC4D_01560 [Thermoleophilia bacterium]